MNITSRATEFQTLFPAVAVLLLSIASVAHAQELTHATLDGLGGLRGGSASSRAASGYPGVSQNILTLP